MLFNDVAIARKKMLVQEFLHENSTTVQLSSVNVMHHDCINDDGGFAETDGSFRMICSVRWKIAKSSQISALEKNIIVLFFANLWFIPRIPPR